jgi:hypothetical protein
VRHLRAVGVDAAQAALAQFAAGAGEAAPGADGLIDSIVAMRGSWNTAAFSMRSCGAPGGALKFTAASPLAPSSEPAS